MNVNKIGKKTINIANKLVNNTVLIIMLALMSLAGYALWDSNQLHQGADKSKYEIYKPRSEDEGQSFADLQAINDEVIGWLTVYGTNIDYPVTQGEDNMKYVNTSAEGQYSLSGAIFLDHGNNKAFSDFNNILYGHHMAKKVMFGEIEEFANKEMFENNKYGNLYANNIDYGIEFFAFIHVDAYDGSVFRVNIKEENQEAYLENIIDKAIHYREIGISVTDRIILLSTCSSNSTNGRDILIGRITDETYDDPTIIQSDDNSSRYTNTKDNISIKIPLAAMLLIIVFIMLILVRMYDVMNKKRGQAI